MPPEAPAQVRRAMVLLWASLVLGTLAFLVEAGADEDSEAVLWASVFTFTVPGVLLNIFTAWRHNWARWVLLVFTLAGLALYACYPPDLSQGWVRMAGELLVSVLDLVALYWLFTGEGARWFSPPTAAKKPT